jgi:hypothetical protein
MRTIGDGWIDLQRLRPVGQRLYMPSHRIQQDAAIGLGAGEIRA